MSRRAGTTLCQMNLEKDTVLRMQEIQDLLGARNRTEATVRAVEIAHLVLQTLSNGTTIPGIVVPGLRLPIAKDTAA